jgi:hypothetical protein
VEPETGYEQIAVELAIALRLHKAGASDELIATALAIEPEGVASILAVAEAKLRRASANPSEG